MFVAIHLPDFELQALLRSTPESRGKPLAILTEKGARARVWQCTAAAHESGAFAGMTPSQAQARCGALEIRLRSPAAERSARAAVLDCAGAFSPYVEDTGPGICTLELKGGRKARPEELAAQLQARLERLHLRAQLGLAPNADLALLAAQSASAEPRWRVVTHAAELHFLPLNALPFPERMKEILLRWGLCELRGFVALGREELAARLGPEVLPLYAQATGAVERPLRCIPPVTGYTEETEFEHEIETLEPLLFVLRRQLEQIIVRLEATYLVAAHLTLRLGFARGAAYERTFKIPSPTAQVEVLFRALHTHLERFSAEEPIVSLALSAQPCRPSRQQFGLFESALRDPNQFCETLARLVALLGNERVGFPVVDDTHRPDMFHLEDVPSEITPRTEKRLAKVEQVPVPLLTPATLALRRFRPPLPARVELNSREEPARLMSAAVSGVALAVQGPVLLSGAWWGDQGWGRYEWDVELSDGKLCRVYHDVVQEEWFLEGIYD